MIIGSFQTKYKFLTHSASLHLAWILSRGLGKERSCCNLQKVIYFFKEKEEEKKIDFQQWRNNSLQQKCIQFVDYVLEFQYLFKYKEKHESRNQAFDSRSMKAGTLWKKNYQKFDQWRNNSLQQKCIQLVDY